MTRPTVLVLAPMRTELTPIVRALKLQRAKPPHRAEGEDPTWVGSCGAVDVVAAVAGVGTAHAGSVADAMLDRVGPAHVVVVGVAGGLAPGLAVGDVVVPAVVTSLDDGTEHHAVRLGEREPEGELLTSTQMHGWDVLEAHAEAGAVAIDMETAAVAASCERAGVPWTAIRAMSDLVREGTVDGTTLDLVREDGTTDLGAVARHLARHPGRVGNLAAMGRDAGKATRAATAVLRSELQSYRPTP